MKNSPINPTFKTVFTAFLNEFFPCDPFINAIKECKTYQEMRNVLRDYREDVAEELGVTVISECFECNSKEEELVTLANRVEELEEDEVDTTALTDKLKLECFIANHTKFSLEHFTKLMES